MKKEQSEEDKVVNSEELTPGDDSDNTISSQELKLNKKASDITQE